MSFNELCNNKEKTAAMLGEILNDRVYEKSIFPVEQGLVFLSQKDRSKKFNLLTAGGGQSFGGEVASLKLESDEFYLESSDLTHDAANVLRKMLPWTAPSCLGLATSIGLGDRLGLATPGHIQAVSGSGLRPILAQQSIREMARTQRNPEQVMDCAGFGVLQEGWEQGFGSDADHLKSKEDIDYCLQVGFTLFTIDPGEYVVNDADQMSEGKIAEALENLPWSVLESSLSDLKNTYIGKKVELGEAGSFTVSEAELLRAAVKYAGAVAHTVSLQHYLDTEAAKTGQQYELEMSVDETDSPTSQIEHYYVASELLRLGVKPVSLAPRFVGAFEKGVDYIGDLSVFEQEFQAHAAIARQLGGYKISLHSGSDKFSIYPLVAKHTAGLVHVKTAGTSYLEALRAIAQINPALFKEILTFALDNYAVDKATYHVSAQREKMLEPAKITDGDLPAALDQFDTRQAFHVTFGSVLTRKNAEDKWLFRDRFYAALEGNEEVHYACLKQHLLRHIQPFSS